jgi:ribosomal protein S18 acetylase RimI-like enzyme
MKNKEGIMSERNVRPAQAADRDAILAFCAHTWEWGDYIDHVWDAWFHDPAGCMLVATANGQPVGMIHMVMPSEHDAWLQGLRVDPNFRNQGLAKMLNDAALLEAMRRGATYARLTIDSKNTPSLRLVERSFWRQIGAFAICSASALPVAQRGASQEERTRLATLDDLDDIIDYLNSSSNFPLTGGIYYAGFTGVPISEELLQARIADRQVYLLRRWERLDGLAIANVRDERMMRLSVGYIDGMTVESISLIAYDLRCLLNELEVSQVRIYAPDVILIRDGLNGVEYEWDGAVYHTYERSLQ